MNRFPAIALVMLALGCEATTEPVGKLSFVRDVDIAGLPEVEVSPSTIEHRGILALPCVPYHVRAALADAEPHFVEIHVVGEFPGNCYDMVGQATYLARVTGLASGLYTLRVVHSWPATGWQTDTVLVTSLNVP